MSKIFGIFATKIFDIFILLNTPFKGETYRCFLTFLVLSFALILLQVVNG